MKKIESSIRRFRRVLNLLGRLLGDIARVIDEVLDVVEKLD